MTVLSLTALSRLAERHVRKAGNTMPIDELVVALDCIDEARARAGIRLGVLAGKARARDRRRRQRLHRHSEPRGGRVKARSYRPPPKQLVTVKRDSKIERRRRRLAALERVTGEGSDDATRSRKDRRVAQHREHSGRVVERRVAREVASPTQDGGVPDA